MNEFLNGKSMITPGVAGGIVMLISNVAWTQFGLPIKWTGLVLSFLLGTLVFAATAGTLWQKGLLYFLNSAIIFSVAAGTNQGAANLAGSNKQVELNLPRSEYHNILRSRTARPYLLPSPSPSASPAASEEKLRSVLTFKEPNTWFPDWFKS